MTEPPIEENSPNRQLASIVVNSLHRKGLLPEKYRETAAKKIEGGQASASDWRLWAEELVMAREKKDEDTSKD